MHAPPRPAGEVDPHARARAGAVAWVLAHRRIVVGAWSTALVAVCVAAFAFGTHATSGGYVVAGSASDRVARLLESRGSASGQLAAVLVQRAPDGAALRAAEARVDAAVAAVPALTRRRRVATRRLADGRRVRVVSIVVPADRDTADDAASALRDRLRPGRRSADGVTTYLVGQSALWAALTVQAREDLQRAETIGLPIVLLVLLAVFGSLTAAVLPLAFGALSVVVTAAAVALLARVLPVSVYAMNVASMIGIGVAVDYCLFVLVRYRQELARGAPPDAARATAMATAGGAVAFSGLTVIAALAGVLLVNAAAVRSMAIGAIVVVAVAVAATLTLLPLLLARAGGRGRRRGAGTSRATAAIAAFTRVVLRRPALAATLGILAIAALAVPALSLQVGTAALRQLPRDGEARVGTAIASQALGAGATAPIIIAAEPAAGAGGRRLARAVVRRAQRVPGVVVDPARKRLGGTRLLRAHVRAEPDEPRAQQAVRRLRDQLAGTAGGRVSVGGATAQGLDFEDVVAGSIPGVIALLAFGTFSVLLIALRAPILAAKAVVLSLLPVAASYGVLVAVFQWGWLSWAGIESLGYVDAVALPFVLAVAFGLSMDYQLFILSRLREEVTAGVDTSPAVAGALRATALPVLQAALLMVVVFSLFVATGVPSVQQVGLGLAVAVALDATIVRLAILPATLRLLGPLNWWKPGRSDAR